MRPIFIVVAFTCTIFVAGANAEPITEEEVQALIDRHTITGKTRAERQWHNVLRAIRGEPGGMSLKRARAKAEKARDKKPKWHKRWLRIVEAIELAQQKEQALNGTPDQAVEHQALAAPPATQDTNNDQDAPENPAAKQILDSILPTAEAAQAALSAHSFGGTLAPSSQSGIVRLGSHGKFGYGYWLSKDEDAGAWSVGVFARGFTKSTAFSDNADHITGNLISDSNETATYSGKAIGLAVRDTDGNGTLASGGFTADVTISAQFLSDGAAFSGIVNNFSRGKYSGDDHIDSGWSVTLNSNSVSGIGGGVGVADGGGASGEWIAVPYGKVADERPFGIAGAFNATFTDGQALGAFGADKE